MDILEQHGCDPAKFYLGSICKRGHDWNNTGKSLRHGISGNCAQCLKDFVAERREEYNARKVAKYHRDKESARRSANAYRAANPDKVKEYKRRYYEKHKEQIRERGKSSYQKNRNKNLVKKRLHYAENRDRLLSEKREMYRQDPQKILERNRLWRKRNPEKSLVRSRRRFHRKKGVHVVPYKLEDILLRFAEFGNRCAYCGSRSKQTKDHFLPISLGGADVISNIVSACHSCNSSKHNNDPLEWYKRQEFYSDRRWRKILKILGKSETGYAQIPLL